MSVICTILTLSIFLSPQQNILDMDVLAVLYTSTFTRTLTPAEIEIFHQEMSKFKYWYDHNLGDLLNLNIDFVQIDRTLSPKEIGVRSDGGTYFSPNKTLKEDLKSKGVSNNKYSSVMLYYAWRNFVPPWNAFQIYGGGAMGPDTSISLIGDPGNTGFFSVSALTWGPDMSGFSVHEFTHNLDAMFYMCEMDTEMLHGDHMANNMPLLLKELPGTFLPDFTDEEMLENARLEKKGEYGFEWKHQEIYYTWILNRPEETWLKLAPRYGKITPKDRKMLVPLYGEIITAKGNSAYLAVFFYDEDGNSVEGATITANIQGKTIPFHNQRLERSEDTRKGKDNPIWSFPLYSCSIPIDFDEKEEILITAKKGNLKTSTKVTIHPTNLGMIDATPLIIVQKDMRDSPTITCRVVEEALNSKGNIIKEANVKAVLDTDTILLNNTDNLGTHWGSFSELCLGIHTVELIANSKDFEIPVRYIDILCKFRWDLTTKDYYTGIEDENIEITADVFNERGKPVIKVKVGANTGKDSIELLDPDNDGTFEGSFESLPPERYDLKVKALRTDRPYSITKIIPLEVKTKGTIEGEDNIPPFMSSGDRASIQHIGSWGKEWQGIWSGDKQLFYTSDSIGDFVVFELDITESKNYEISGYFTKANDYGIFQMNIDGETFGEAFDGYNSEVVRSEKIKFGRIFLDEGKHELRLEIIDKNPESRSYFIGVDCFIIR
ncbi:hypothetical protein KAX02_01870 [candidate division WOR-3 bacterium]|nr:hypothetical protein [candidate division WOR-3 bacterium]